MVSTLQILGLPRATIRAHGLAGLMVASSLMTGCGQKGPLFIATPPVAPATTGSSPATQALTGPAAPLSSVPPAQPASAASAPR